MFYAIMDTSGVYPETLCEGPRLPPGAIQLDHEIGFYLDAMLVDGLWEARPKVSPPIITHNEDGTVDVVFSDLPVGAVVVVHDTEIGSDLASIPEDAGVVEFRLVDPASYQIEAIVEKPWIGWEGKVH